MDEPQTPVPPEAPAPSRWRWLDWALAGFLAALAFCLFGKAAGGIVYPDNSSQVIAEQLGLLPNVSPLFPIWSWLLRLAAGAGDVAGAAFRMHLLGRLSAALSAALLYWTVFGVLRGLLFPAGVTRGYSLAMGVVSRLCASSAALLLFCPPVCHAAAAPHSAIFTVVFGVLAGAAALHFLRSRSLGALLLSAVVAAIGCLESPGVLLVLPWWLAIVFLAPGDETEDGDSVGCTFRGHAMLSGWAAVIWLAAAVLVFAGGAALSADAFARSEGAQFVHLRGFGDAFAFFLRRYLSELRQVYPAGGYLLVLLGVLAPAALAVTLSPGYFSERHSVWHILLYAIIGVVSASQALPASRACLWVYIPSSTMRTGACMLGALSFPFSLGFFLITAVRVLFPALIALGPGGRENGAALGVEKPVRQLLVGLAFSLAALALAGIPFFGAAHLRAREDAEALALVEDYLAELAASVDGRPWAVTDHTFDSALRLVSKGRGMEAQPLPYALRQDSGERRIAGAASLESPLDRDDFAIGTGTLLREWCRHAPEKVSRVSVLTAPDVWIGTGYRLEPSGLVLVPVPEGTTADVDGLLAAQREVWKRWIGRADGVHPANRALRPLVHAIRRQLSLTATEFGGLCEAEGRPDAALEAYEAARSLDGLNLVARYNLQAILPEEDGRRGPLEAEIADLRTVFDAVPVGALMCLQGRIAGDAVRQRLALAEIARSEMRTTTGTFLSQMQAASADRRLSTHRAAASLGAAFLARREWGEARAEYEPILAESPDFLPALYGMAVLSAHEAKDADAADPWLERLRGAGVGEEPAAVFKALLLKELDEPDRVMQLLAPLAHEQQESQDVWLLWGWAAVQLGNAAARHQAYRHLSARSGARRLELYAAYREGDVHLVSMKRRALLDESPSDTTLRKAAMGAAWAEADVASAKRLARTVLQEDDRHAPAHFVVGMAFALEGRADLALPHLLRAEEYGLASAALFNNLAMVLLERNDLERAEGYARRALELSPDSPEVVDTLVAVEVAAKHFTEAQEHLRAALEKDPGNRILRKRMYKVPGFALKQGL